MRQGHRPSYLLWVALGTALMAMAMAYLLALQVTQQRAIQKSASLRTDSITALVFQLEREFLRLRAALERTASDLSNMEALEAAKRRQDIFVSRIQLLQDTPSSADLAKRAEYTKVMPALQLLVEKVDFVLAMQPHPAQHELHVVMDDMEGMAQDILALSMSANSHISGLIEEQENTLLFQGKQVVALIVGQMALLLIAAVTLVMRHRRQEQERMAMEALTASLQEATLIAESANRGKSQFLANMSHELRTPFNGVLGMLTLLEGTPLSNEQNEYVGTARQSASHLLTLLNDILDVSALEAGKMNIHPIPVALPQVLDDIQRLMAPVAHQKSLTFRLESATDLPAWIEADVTRVKQIILNLVTNAIKFSESGIVHLQATAQKAADGTTLIVAVKDQGIGMDEATLARLFQRFSQGDGSTSRRFGGSGLGLEISRNLARLMGGDITVHSALGQGSTFTLQLPLTIIDTPPTAERMQQAMEYRPNHVQGLDILVAEDQPVNRKYMEGLLRRMGHRVRFAENGAQAVQAVDQAPPDLVFMDLHMPVMDGLDATRAIRASHGLGNPVRIVALTADAFLETQQKAADAGTDGFISKPASADAIQQMLTQLFGERGAPAAPEPVSPLTPVAPLSSSSVSQPTSEPLPPRPKRRRFRPGDLTQHLNMAQVGEVCIGVTLTSYRELANSFLSDESATLLDLLEALRCIDTSTLRGKAHAFKGAAASLGFQALAERAQAIEHEGERYTAINAQKALSDLHDLWDMAHALAYRMGLTDVEQPAHLAGMVPETAGNSLTA